MNYVSPILSNKNPASPSVFFPTALLREARRQKGLAEVSVPPFCILDPDGDGHTKGGLAAGVGVETNLWDNWSTKLEYLYMDFGSISDTYATNLTVGPGTFDNVDSKIRDHIVRVGLNYKFGGR